MLKARLGGWRYRLFSVTGALVRPSQRWPEVSYRIQRNAMVEVIRNGRLQTRLCVIAGQGEPEADRIMSVLDLIESGQEERLWEMANVFPELR